MCLYAVRRGAPEPQWAAWFAGTAEQKKAADRTPYYTSIGQTLRQCTTGPSKRWPLNADAASSDLHTFSSYSLLARQVTVTRVPYSPEISPHVDKVDTLSCSSADSNNSGPIACRVPRPVCLGIDLGYTHLKPPRHLYSVPNKRCLMLRLRLCDQCCQVRGRTRAMRPWLLTTLAQGCCMAFGHVVVSAATISVPNAQTLRTPGWNTADHRLPFVSQRDRLAF